MKKRTSIISFVVSLVLTFICQFASAEGVITYGGGPVQRSFYKLSQEVLKDLEVIPDSIFPVKGGLDDIKTKFKAVSVQFSEDPLIWQGAEVLAINSPFEIPAKLFISIPKWRELINKTNELKRILLHEILHLSLIDDHDYIVSEMLMEGVIKIKSKNQSGALFSFYQYDPLFLKVLRNHAAIYFSREPDDRRLFDELIINRNSLDNQDLDLWLEVVEIYLSQLGIPACSSPEIHMSLGDLKYSNDPFLQKVYEQLSHWEHLVCWKLHMSDDKK